ncbi:hypothetical protein PR202_ga03706 [Eleusine coracana subsp. coracana]|uniref:Uncharacterized protein n=1 Tax=Eleusine coracana subsp. coracana TaxID=191504 RepID=A0AAV5BP52_ELECO|nr:hypothetical protein PR202_ga03706 [Eleusine coracana subsp. coracana]
MARKKITQEDRQRIERARKIKKKAKNRKPGRDGEGKVTTLKGDGLCAICDDGGDLVWYSNAGMMIVRGFTTLNVLLNCSAQIKWKPYFSSAKCLMERDSSVPSMNVVCVFFSDITMEEGPNGQMQRAWDKYEEPDGGIIHLDPILIYCTKHEIIEKLGTPKMNHIIFPKTIREPKILVGPPTEEDTPEEEEDHPSPEQSQPPPIEADTPEETEVTDQPSPEPSQPPLIEEDTPEEQKVPHHPLPEPSQTPLAAMDQNQCLCSCPLDSFAPRSLFPHPHPGTGGWLGD